MKSNLIFIFLSLLSSTLMASNKYDLGPKISEEQMSKKEAEIAAENKSRDFAKAACIQYVKSKLNDPSSAVFPSGKEERGKDAIGVKNKDGTWKVTFTGRARNGFNALTLSRFQCNVSPIEIDGKNSMLVNSAKELKK